MAFSLAQRSVAGHPLRQKRIGEVVSRIVNANLWCELIADFSPIAHLMGISIYWSSTTDFSLLIPDKRKWMNFSSRSQPSNVSPKWDLFVLIIPLSFVWSSDDSRGVKVAPILIMSVVYTPPPNADNLTQFTNIIRLFWGRLITGHVVGHLCDLLSSWTSSVEYHSLTQLALTKYGTPRRRWVID